MKPRDIPSQLPLMSVLGLPLAGRAWWMRSPPPPPRSSASQRFTIRQGRENILPVQDNPVGPPRWKHLVESLHPVAITNSPPPGWSGTGWFPAWHPAGLALTNVAIDIAGCAALDISSNWQVGVASSLVLAPTSSDANELRFTLECDKTNGPVEIKVSNAEGANTVVRNFDGPR